MRVLFEGVDYSKKLSTLKVKQALMPLYDAISWFFMMQITILTIKISGLRGLNVKIYEVLIIIPALK